MLIYAITLPPATAPDVTKWEASIVVNGGEESIIEVTDGAELPGFNDNDAVVLKVREYDNATPPNVSEWGPEFGFTAADTIAPSAPGAPGVNLLREEG